MKQFKTISDGVWIVEENVQLEELTIRAGASIAAPTGKKVTLTVNGVATKPAPGVYQGDVRLTVTDDIPVPFFAYDEPMEYRAAVYVKDGKVQENQSVPAAVKAGEISGAEAKDVKIVCRDDAFNGILIDGDGEYTINGADLMFEGLGGTSLTQTHASV